VLIISFAATSLMAILMSCPLAITLTIGALGMALAIGLGNGAIFKLVPQFFPRTVGTVTGVVGALGALGGCIPTIVLGLLRQGTGTFFWGFIFLNLFALGCLAICVRMIPKPH
jgi:NNP family nitrate/nitrite transporter-like MFS transporter